MHQGRRGEKRIHVTRRCAKFPGVRHDDTPPVRNSVVDRKDTSREPRREIPLEPLRELPSTATMIQELYAEANFRNRGDAEMDVILMNPVEPPEYLIASLRLDKL